MHSLAAERTGLKPISRICAVVPLAFLLSVSGCALTREARCAFGEEPFVSDVMYFGTAKLEGVVTPEEWDEFLRTVVTPRFPQGFTVWPAAGQWKGANGEIIREASFVLSVLRRDDERSERELRAISAEYKARFGQEAVLRVRNPVCVSF